jgi:adenine-specific DNA-methyltransferase
VDARGLSIDQASLRKARGAFFTPRDLCDYVVRWAVRKPEDIVLEPSCGEAAFLLSAGSRLRSLNGSGMGVANQLRGVELHADSAQAAVGLLASESLDARVAVGDFFSMSPTPTFDAVVGNPPYVRYQAFSGAARARSRAAALRAGVSLTGLASSWAAFTVHASLFLKAEGRLGLVLPAELLTVNYAAEVRRYLMKRFARVRLVLFSERVFPGVQEEVVLLLAEGSGPTDHCELYQVRDVADLSRTGQVARLWKPASPEGKWTPSLMSASTLEMYLDVAMSESFGILDDWGDTTLGMVTGNNRYFALSPERARELRLAPRDLIQVSPPGSRHLRGLSFSESAWKELGNGGRSTLLFRPAREPSKAGSAYIAAGETLDVQKAYKCRMRSPWWRVPLVKPADVLLTYMNADTPRLCANRVGAHHLNSVHGVYLRPGRRRVGMDLLPLAALNSMTLLGAETVGRAYGGGMLKLEPNEADQLPLPTQTVLEEASTALSALRPQMAKALRNGRLLDAVRLVDDTLLVGQLGLARSKVKALREAHADLVARRIARGAEPRGED